MDETGTRAAHEELAYIRRTLDAAGRLSSISGSGLVAIGLLALAAVAISRLINGAPWDANPHPDAALAVWGLLLAASFVIGLATMARKAARLGVPFWSPVLRKALWGSGAAMLLGGLLTVAALRAARPELLPVIWLGCYGAALTSAGTMSVSPVRWMGVSFLALAAAAAVTPASAGLLLLAAGFGGIHILFGGYIAWRHDG